MSVFSPDTITKEIDYRPDPHENMCFQITRMFNKVCDWYDPSYVVDPMTQFKNWMGSFMEDLEQNSWRETPVLPKWWKGDFKYFIGWRVIILKCTDGRKGLQVMWRYADSINWTSIDLYVDLTGMTQKYKNWVL